MEATPTTAILASSCTTVNSVQTVWNKGIAALCDRRFPDEFPDTRHYRPVPSLAGALASRWLSGDLISKHASPWEVQDGDVVWVRLSWLKSFVKEVLPRLESDITLITADSDSCVPSELGSLATRVLASPRVRHWYTQNFDGSVISNRISPLPIGVDFHMLSERAIWGEQQATPLEQEQLLFAIRDSLPRLNDRIRKVYVDFGWQRGPGLGHYRRYVPLKGTRFTASRFQLAKTLQSNPAVDFQSRPLPRSEMWRRRGEYAFVLSPHGIGLDCHRTWEALALGHIVLVPSSSLDPLYAGLPVVSLRSWDEITPANLERWQSDFKTFDGNHEKLTSDYWVHGMRNQDAGIRKEMACVPL